MAPNTETPSPERYPKPCTISTSTSWPASPVLYVGVTNDIRQRVWQHQHDELPGFTSKYQVHRLVYFERFQYVRSAIARETEIKGWLRRKKIALIEAENPTWEDLSEGWYKKQILPLRQAQGQDDSSNNTNSNGLG